EFVVGYFTRLLEKYQLLCAPQPPQGCQCPEFSLDFGKVFKKRLHALWVTVSRVMEERPQFKDCELLKIECFKPYRPPALTPFYYYGHIIFQKSDK
ncbi:hypothetical protein ACJ73_05616, partial [Blastomyces percursus]